MVFLGLFFAFFSGLVGGLAPLPLKYMRRYGYEHWGLVVAIIGYLAIPWLAVFAICPDTFGALRDIPVRDFIVGNVFSMAWGIANVLYFLCLMRIGFSLGQSILAGTAIPAGVVIPMLLKASGKFADSPGPLSASGLTILAGTIAMLVGVRLVAKAGFGREAAQGGGVKRRDGGFMAGLVMSIVAGILSIGISFSFVYTQEPIAEAFIKHGTDENAAPTAVRAATLLGGALVNLLYPLWLLCKNRSWGVFVGPGSLRDFMLSLPIGIITIVSFVMGSTGMVMLGALGASVGFGINQAMQIAASQAVGRFTGEWRGVPSEHIRTMTIAVIVLLASVAIVAVARAM